MNKIELPKKISLQRLLWEKMLAMTLLVLLCCFAGTTAFAQNTVRGKVTSNTGDPVAGASVSVKGTSIGTNTGMDGSFTIQAAKGAILVISSITYATKEITVGDENTINIQLTPSATDLGEVVVVGYGTQRKEAVTGSVASIGGEKMREVPSPNVSQALQGRLPGVDIAQTSTQPGSTMQIRIRGTRSLTGDNNPLIVLDGIPF